MDNNIKRKKRKRRIRTSTLFFLFLTLASNSFAWFIYSTRVSNSITAKVRSWHVSFNVSSGESASEYIEVNIDNIYPGMQPFYQELKASNDGEADARITYEVVSANVLGDDLIEKGMSSSEIIDSFKNSYPFIISISASSDIITAGGSEESITISASWDYDSGNDEEDTKWGEKAYDFHRDNPLLPSIKLLIKVSAVQI